MKWWFQGSICSLAIYMFSEIMPSQRFASKYKQQTQNSHMSHSLCPLGDLFSRAFFSGWSSSERIWWNLGLNCTVNELGHCRLCKWVPSLVMAPLKKLIIFSAIKYSMGRPFTGKDWGQWVIVKTEVLSHQYSICCQNTWFGLRSNLVKCGSTFNQFNLD